MEGGGGGSWQARCPAAALPCAPGTSCFHAAAIADPPTPPPKPPLLLLLLQDILPVFPINWGNVRASRRRLGPMATHKDLLRKDSEREAHHDKV